MTRETDPTLARLALALKVLDANLRDKAQEAAADPFGVTAGSTIQELAKLKDEYVVGLLILCSFPFHLKTITIIFIWCSVSQHQVVLKRPRR